jgi:hypothetical protein
VVFQGNRDSDPNFEPSHYTETKLFAHELGHLLGLFHGGDSDKDNQAPNYQSVMNYRYQWNLKAVGAPGYVFDYSQETTPLDETSLYEAEGLISTLPVADQKTITWDCEPGSSQTTEKGDPGTAASPNPLDWDCDGATDPAGVATEADISGKDRKTMLPGHDDWANLHFGLVCNDYGNRDWVSSGEPFAAPANLHPFEWLDASVDAAPACSGHEVPLDDVVPVEVVAYGSSDWAAADVVLARTRFGGAAPLQASLGDRDGDGHDDVTFWFRSTEMTLMHSGSSAAIFNAHLLDGRALYAKPPVTPGTYVDADANGILDVCEGP